MEKLGRYRTETGLTRKQERFCQEYLINGFNASEAARKAGYSKDADKEIGYDLLTKAHIQKYIQRLTKDTINEEYVLNKIVETLNKAQNQDKLSEVLKASELLGKYLAMFTDKNINQTETLEDVILKLGEKTKVNDKVTDKVSKEDKEEVKADKESV